MASGDIVRGVAAQTAQPALSGISQTAFIFGAVGFMFLVFITLRGDLPKWLGLLGLAPSTTPATGQIGSTPGTSPLGAPVPDVLSGNYGNPGSNVLQFPAPPQLGTIVQ